jgi:two-component system, NtrC family, response regulator AtoC
MTTTKSAILVVDDDHSFRTYITLFLRDRGYLADGLENGQQLIARLATERPALILLDVLLPDNDGIQIIGKMREMGVNVPVVMLSGVGHVRTVVEAMKLGAVDFLQKPFEDSALEDAINTAIANGAQQQETFAATSAVERAPGFVTLNPKMLRLVEIVKRVAHTDVPILIAGESGVGKEVMARLAHAHSGRQDRAFIKVNCAAMPSELLESELFGYERGAFTGAVTDKPGKFELAHTGTLLLDEIGEMSPLLQAKLLHVLQDGTFSRLGGRKTVQVDARIIAATNIDIEKSVSEGKFREDLYFRLNVIRIDLPPLRERREDIPALCNYFVQTYRERYKSQVREMPLELLNHFVEHDWPGNIRELENSIKRFLVLPGHYPLPSAPTRQSEVPAFSASAGAGAETAAPESFGLLDLGLAAADRAQKELVNRILAETNGNRKQAAKRMNISYKALLNKLKRWNIGKGQAA